MDDLTTTTHSVPQALLDALAESDADQAAGRIVAGDALLRRIDLALERMGNKPD